MMNGNSNVLFLLVNMKVVGGKLGKKKKKLTFSLSYTAWLNKEIQCHRVL